MKSIEETIAENDRNRALLTRIVECKTSGADLNDWESDFIDHMEDWVISGKGLSEKQMDALEKIEYLVSFGRDAYWEEYGNG